MLKDVFAKIVRISQKAKLLAYLLIIGQVLSFNEFDTQFVIGPITTNYNVDRRRIIKGSFDRNLSNPKMDSQIL